MGSSGENFAARIAFLFTAERSDSNFSYLSSNLPTVLAVSSQEYSLFIMASSSVLDNDEVTVVGVAKAPPQPQPSSLINLFDTDDDDEDEGAAYTASMMQSLTSQKKKKRKASSSAMAHHASAAKKPASSSGADAIEILDGGSSNNNDDSQENRNETTYRQALGPVRMDFVPSWRSSSSTGSTNVTGSSSSSHSHYSVARMMAAAGAGVAAAAAGTTSSSAGQEHVFAQQAAAATSRSRVGSRNLYKELLEYQLNLPVNWSSSIFCRAQEARTDLLRVLITGALRLRVCVRAQFNFGWLEGKGIHDGEECHSNSKTRFYIFSR